MSLPFESTETRYGEVKLAPHGVAKPKLVVQSDDPRLGGDVGWARIYMLSTDPIPSFGSVGEFAFSRDRKILWAKDVTGWEEMGQLIKQASESQIKVITPAGVTGSIEVST